VRRWTTGELRIVRRVAEAGGSSLDAMHALAEAGYTRCRGSVRTFAIDQGIVFPAALRWRTKQRRLARLAAQGRDAAD
jgi:hypothetical protein